MKTVFWIFLISSVFSCDAELEYSLNTSSFIDTDYNKETVDSIVGSSIEIETSDEISSVKVCSDESCSLNCSADYNPDDNFNTILSGLESSEASYLCGLKEGTENKDGNWLVIDGPFEIDADAPVFKTAVSISSWNRGVIEASFHWCHR